MYEIENNMPRFMQKQVHVKKAVVKPTDGRTCTEKVCSVSCTSQSTHVVSALDNLLC